MVPSRAGEFSWLPLPSWPFVCGGLAFVDVGLPGDAIAGAFFSVAFRDDRVFLREPVCTLVLFIEIRLRLIIAEPTSGH
jgi:hypothetical protein